MFLNSFKTFSGVKTVTQAPGGMSTSVTNYNDGTTKLKVEGPTPLVPFTTISFTTTSSSDGNTFKAEIGNSGPLSGKVGVQYNTTSSNTTVTGTIEFKTKSTRTSVTVGTGF
jgi:hypothetical protein